MNFCFANVAHIKEVFAFGGFDAACHDRLCSGNKLKKVFSSQRFSNIRFYVKNLYRSVIR